MKYLFAIIFILSCVCLHSQVNPNNHYVRPYVKKNGTVVQGHYRTNRNDTNRDNYTTKPNVNPYTGTPGIIEPDNNNYLPNYNYSTYSTTPNYESTRYYDIDSYYRLESQKDDNISYDSGADFNTQYDDNQLGNQNWQSLDDLQDEHDRWMREEYPKIQAEQERWIREEYPKIQAEQERWLREEYPQIQSRYSRLGQENNYSYANITIRNKKEIDYHFRYSLSERKIIEEFLDDKKYLVGEVDGDFTSTTVNAIKNYQQQHGLIQDGLVGPKTLTVMINSL
ncbi:peptidoglycan-binding domain-containing protein [Lewinella sp. IMCC34183]|uniref:peptidoglycan-binding domain-containing protein n=1 Tax=Lewinella sp. IMCC34183 TaxID=2248762 RepID=UPI000E256020|nr:peptidoglycan-binding domain-containing protein [Lewinella sp. IMCC34183]